MGGSEAKMNDDGEPDMQTSDSSMSNAGGASNTDLGGEEQDMSPGPNDPQKYNKSLTNQSLGLLGAGQPYNKSY